ncbi:hypothetical protein WMF04_19835 [Sorangium sp. So ce260]
MIMTQPMKLLRKKVRHGLRVHPLATAIDHGPGDARATERDRDA